MTAPKDYQEIERAAKKVAEKTRFPIRNFEQLADALGGEEAEIDFDGKGRKVGHARKALPDGFFPVESEQDLIAKAGYVRALITGSKPEHTPGEQGKEKSEKAGDPPDLGPSQGRKGGIPAITGKKD